MRTWMLASVLVVASPGVLGSEMAQTERLVRKW